MPPLNEGTDFFTCLRPSREMSIEEAARIFANQDRLVKHTARSGNRFGQGARLYVPPTRRRYSMFEDRGEH